MPDTLRTNQDAADDAPLLATIGEAAPPADGKTGGLSRRRKAWLGIAAVLVVLAMLTWLPTGAVDSNAPPPVPDSASTPLSGVDAGFSAVGMEAPLNFALKDVDGIE